MTTPPVTPEKLRELVNMPAGEAGKWVRKNVDPLWGLSCGETFDFKVSFDGRLTREERFSGAITVSAPDPKHAEKIAWTILDQNDPKRQFTWESGNPLIEDWDDEDWNVTSVKKL